MDDTEVGTTVAHAIADGKAMADDGQAYDSAQDAVDAATNWVWLPPNTTFNERIVINKENLTLKGSGYTTVVDGGNKQTITVEEDNLTIKNLRLNNDGSVNDGNIIINFNGNNNGTVSNCYCTESDWFFVRGVSNAKNISVVNNYIGGERGVDFDDAQQCLISGNIFQVNGSGVFMGGASDDNIMSYNIFDNPGDRALFNDGADNIFIGNRVISAGDDGFLIRNGPDVIVANNRISDSAAQDIDNTANGTLLDSNLTGGAN